jgi:hypothetical protein
MVAATPHGTRIYVAGSAAGLPKVAVCAPYSPTRRWQVGAITSEHKALAPCALRSDAGTVQDAHMVDCIQYQSRAHDTCPLKDILKHRSIRASVDIQKLHPSLGMITREHGKAEEDR